ncbi:unnamed protein product, partial [Amoebophrya sp. A25]|eukprot:GSA25T00008077001.1
MLMGTRTTWFEMRSQEPSSHHLLGDKRCWTRSKGVKAAPTLTASASSSGVCCFLVKHSGSQMKHQALTTPFSVFAFLRWLVLIACFFPHPLLRTTGVIAFPIADPCRADTQMVELVEKTLHTSVQKMQHRCTRAKSDIFQRVSGHLVKHKIEEFCAEGVTLLLGALDILHSACVDFNRMFSRAVRQNRFLRRLGKQILPTDDRTRNNENEKFKLPQSRDKLVEDITKSFYLGFEHMGDVSDHLAEEFRLIVLAYYQEREKALRARQAEEGSGPASGRSEIPAFTVSEETERILRVMFHDGEAIKDLVMRARVQSIVSELRKWSTNTEELLVDFSTGDDWREPIVEHFRGLLKDDALLFDQNPMRLANQLLNFAPYVVDAVLSTVSEVVNYHLGDFHVKQYPTLFQQIEAFPQLVQPQVRLVSSIRGPKFCRSLLGFDARRDPLLAKRRLWSDITGLYSLQPTILDHLEHYSEQLSYTVIGMQPRAVIGAEKLQDTYRSDWGRDGSEARAETMRKFGLTKEDLRCNATGLAYTPTRCLFDAGWGSLTFTINTEPPYDAT